MPTENFKLMQHGAQTYMYQAVVDCRAAAQIRDSMCPVTTYPCVYVCTGDSGISTMTSPVFCDVRGHTWSSATSKRQEKKDRSKGRITKSTELVLCMFQVLYKH